MKLGKGFRAIAGILLCAGGLIYSLPTPYREKSYLIHASGCELVTTIVEPPSGAAQGAVVLVHGLAANRKLMSYTARAFAEEGLRVYVPDLPGHGRTAGPFSPARAEQCTEALLRELMAHGATTPERTILAGHSMGGAIAIRVAARLPVAGVIATSPAPMRAAHGALKEVLPYTDPPPLPANTLVLSGSLEPDSMRGNAKDLFTGSVGEGSKYFVIRGASHVSLLFDPRVARATQEWAAKTLHLDSSAGLPSLSMVGGSLAGFFGLLLIAGPFLQETISMSEKENAIEEGTSTSVLFGLLEFAAVCLGAVGVLNFWNPFRAIQIFEGDYFAGFLFFAGMALVLLQFHPIRVALKAKFAPMAGAVFAAMVLLLLTTAWFDLTFSEAWISAAKWPRFPILFLATLPYHLGEEILLGEASRWRGLRRLGAGMLLRLLGWLALVCGIFFLHSGEVLLVLMAPYLAVFCVLQRCGMDVVRKGTGSATAAAVFGAILLAGFCLVIFPIT